MVVILNRLYSEVGKTQYTTLLDYDSNGNLIYAGTATPSSASNNSLWRISKLTYTSDYNISSIRYADGNSSFDNIWINRTILTYV